MSERFGLNFQNIPVVNLRLDYAQAYRDALELAHRSETTCGRARSQVSQEPHLSGEAVGRTASGLVRLTEGMPRAEWLSVSRRITT